MKTGTVYLVGAGCGAADLITVRGMELLRRCDVLVYDDQNNVRHACVFRPNEEMCRALAERLRERFGFDERMTHGKVRTLYSRALERAFPSLYPYVDPLVKPEDVAWAKEQTQARKAEKNAKAKAKDKSKKPDGQGETSARRRRKQG